MGEMKMEWVYAAYNESIDIQFSEIFQWNEKTRCLGRKQLV